jgi:hypothetical protein
MDYTRLYFLSRQVLHEYCTVMDDGSADFIQFHTLGNSFQVQIH